MLAEINCDKTLSPDDAIGGAIGKLFRIFGNFHNKETTPFKNSFGAESTAQETRAQSAQRDISIFDCQDFQWIFYWTDDADAPGIGGKLADGLLMESSIRDPCRHDYLVNKVLRRWAV